MSGAGEPAGTGPVGRAKGIDRDLDVLFAHVRTLREVHADPKAGREGVYDFAVRWGTYLSGRLPRLQHYYARDELTPAERERYEALLTELRDVLPLVDDLDLTGAQQALADAEENRRHPRRKKRTWR